MGVVSRRALPGEYGPVKRGPNPASVLGLILVAIVLIVAFVFLFPNAFPGVRQTSHSNASSSIKSSSSILSSGGTSSSNSTAASTLQGPSPDIVRGTANITYPSDYSILSTYALGLINKDRANSSLGAVSLSTSMSGQQHADSMLYYDYFSHWDTQGYPPYMRYTLLGGTGAVEENIARSTCTDSTDTFAVACTQQTIENAIYFLEYSMMNADLQCCQNGHRDNILNPLHNRVSIGIAYNGSVVFFDEDFENYYVKLSFSRGGPCTASSSSCTVSMTGTPLASGISSNDALVTFNRTPASISPAGLNGGPREYTAGEVIGGVLPPCSLFSCEKFQNGTTVYASVWTFTPSKVDISFSLADFVSQYGAGVYNIYLMTGSDTDSAITSFSVFVS